MTTEKPGRDGAAGKFPETASLTGSFRVEGRGLEERAREAAACDCGADRYKANDHFDTCAWLVIPALLQEIERQDKLLADYRTRDGALDLSASPGTRSIHIYGVGYKDVDEDGIAAHRRIMAAEKERG